MTDTNRRNRMPVILALGAKIKELESEVERLRAEKAELFVALNCWVITMEEPIISSGDENLIGMILTSKAIIAKAKKTLDTKAKEGSKLTESEQIDETMRRR